jgi:hypothetical protein
LVLDTPRRALVDPGKNAIVLGRFLLLGDFEVGKIFWYNRLAKVGSAAIVSGIVSDRSV